MAIGMRGFLPTRPTPSVSVALGKNPVALRMYDSWGLLERRLSQLCLGEGGLGAPQRHRQPGNEAIPLLSPL